MLTDPGAHRAAALLLPLFLLRNVEKSPAETALKYELNVWYQCDRLYACYTYCIRNISYFDLVTCYNDFSHLWSQNLSMKKFVSGRSVVARLIT